MQKNLKNDLETKYNEIFRNMYIQWKLQSKKKCEELQSNGLAGSGICSKIMYSLMEEIINETISDLQQLFNDLPTKYNRRISTKELNDYRKRTLKNIHGHIDSMKKELKDNYENKLFFITQTSEIFQNNLECNFKDKIEKLFDEIVNLRKGKKMEGLIIFNIVFTILNFLIGIASLIVGIIGIIK